jgi:hypothetical protein
MTWFLDLRAQSWGGGVARDVALYKDDTSASVADLKDAVRNREILIATHGFNVDRASGRRCLSCWERWLSLSPRTVYVAVLWPGDSAWIPAVDYPIEGNEAISAGKLLASFIVTNLLDASTFCFASHSLGARVVLQTIRGLGKRTRVRCLMLMAGAIDDTCLNDEYADAAQAVDKISILASSHDEVLALAFPAGNLFAGIVTRGSPYWHAALGREGPQSTLGGKVQPPWHIPDPWKYGHHNYLAQASPAVAPLALPQNVPPPSTPLPGWATFNEWRASWSASILSSRLS